MRQFFNRKRKTTLSVGLPGLAVVALLGATAASTHVEKRPATEKPPRLAAPPTAASSSLQTGLVERRQLVRIFVHADDIYPDVVTVQPGKVFFVAENETQSDVSLVVERVNAGQAPQRFLQLSTPQRNKRNKEELTLGAGEYEFYAESNSAVRGKLVVAPQ